MYMSISLFQFFFTTVYYRILRKKKDTQPGAKLWHKWHYCYTSYLEIEDSLLGCHSQIPFLIDS